MEVQSALSRIRAGEAVASVETETLECKEDPTTRGDHGQRIAGLRQDDNAARLIADHAVCLANHEGGALLIGVDDTAAGASALVGTELDTAWLRRRVRDFTMPPLTIGVEELNEPKARLLLVLVPRNGGSEPHSAIVSRRGGRRTPRRVLTDCHDMATLAELMAWAQERSSYDWSASPSGRAVSEARSQAIEELRDILRESGEPDRQALIELTDADLLRRLQLLRPDGTLTRAGELLTCAGDRPRLVYLPRAAAGIPAERRIETAGRGLAEELRRVTDAIRARTREIALPAAALARISSVLRSFTRATSA
jgi:ATP-dependent DNA helicase RecG